jgi:hypothetical protein
MIRFAHKGDFHDTDRFFKGAVASNYMNILETYAREGVAALASATPVDSGETANSWGYEIKHDRSETSITWTNSHVVDGVPIAIIIQYGHATGSGVYVQGRDYINPVLQPIFDGIAKDMWGEVTKL